MNASPELIGWIGLIVMIILLFAGLGIGFAMGFIGFVGFIAIGGLIPALNVLSTVPYEMMCNYTISVIPLFLLMGIVAANTGISSDLYKAANTWVGQIRGGLAMATTIACAGFAAICGSSLPEVITMGKIAVPEMKKYNYDMTLATSSIAAAGSLAALIPPSMGLIMYSILTEQSIGKLFVAGILPGVLMTVLFVLVVAIQVIIKPHVAPAGPKTTFKEKILSLRFTWSMIALFLLVMGGIYGGIFTPTEGGGIGAFGAFIIGAAGRRLNKKVIMSSMIETTKTTGMIVVLIIGAFIMMKFVAISQIPFSLANYISGLEVNRYIIFAGIILVYIIVGMFLDIMGAITLTVPILFPVIQALGFDPIWYGVIMVMVIEMGIITPPVGLGVFVLSGVTDIPISTIFKGVWPYVVAILTCVTLVTAFPQIALLLTRSMSG